MSVHSRKDLKDYCLRKLGFPVIQINVDDDQLEDRVDEALQFFQQYHFDATERTYISHIVTDTDINRRWIDMAEASGSASVTAGSNTVIGNATYFSSEFVAGITDITINGETKKVSSITDNRTLTVNSNFAASANGATIRNETMKDSITGVIKVFPITSTSAQVNMFDLRYQLRLHELYDFTSTSYINYVLTMQHLRTLDMLFTGEIPVRFNLHQNRLYVDLNWGTAINAGEILMIEGFRIVDPEGFPRVYNDRWLKKYTTALFKRQWGQNLKKFTGIQLPGGVQLDGQTLYTEAETEIEAIEQAVQSAFETPPDFMLG